MERKIYLNRVSVELGLGGMPNLNVLNEILSYALNGSLPIYFDNDIYGSKVNSTYDRIDESKIMVLGGSSYLQGCKTLVATNHYQFESDFHISLSRFVYKNEEYYPVDESGMWIEFPRMTPTHFYCLADQIQSFKNKKNTNQNRSKKLSRQQELEQAVKLFLTSKTGVKAPDYQRCYSFLKEPTQDDLWDMFQKADRKMFRSGKQDFFKKQNIFKFTEGTGNGRN
ncbi:MAG: hypothetical protein COB38_01775 [Gammaproteobacteria bacterium]|nr:MAG: hypothetical protein COB38_01775 [Gammaproteobacteria bacterium]